MKLSILLLTALFFAACAGGSQNDNAANANAAKAEKNKQIAAKNEVTKITTDAQKLENQGRSMDLLRKVENPNSQRECAAQMEDAQKQVQELEARIKILPEPYNVNLAALTADLSDCVACTKTAMASCVKSRASINQVIKEQFQQ